MACRKPGAGGAASKLPALHSLGVKAMSFRRCVVIGIVAGLLVAGGKSAAPADDIADFYKGKTVTMVVGTPAGGGYDIYARLLARHLGKYIPANPNIIIQ